MGTFNARKYSEVLVTDPEHNFTMLLSFHKPVMNSKFCYRLDKTDVTDEFDYLSKFYEIMNI